MPFRAEGGGKRVFPLGVYTETFCAETHVPFRAEGGEKRVFSLGVYTEMGAYRRGKR